MQTRNLNTGQAHTLLTIVVSTALSVLITTAIITRVLPALEETTGSPNTATVIEATETEVTTTIPSVVATAAPAVVSIVISADIPIIEQYFEEVNPFDRFFGGGFGFSVPRQRQVGTKRQEIGGGTGFIVSADGYIITNRHVVDSDDVDYSVVTNDGTTYDVEIIATDPMIDIAVLKIESDAEFPYLSFGSSENLQLGETTIAIGNALAEFPNSVSVGVVSGLARNITAGSRFSGTMESLEGLIQTDAAINQGNSGGPLLNATGEVIGVNVAVAGGSENIGFALPADTVAQIYESVKEHGEIVRPFLGIRYAEIDTRMAKLNNLPVDYGIIIVRGEDRAELAVVPGSAADKAGLEENDIILEFDGVPLDGERSFASLIRAKQVGETVTLKILHDGEEKTISVTLRQLDS